MAKKNSEFSDQWLINKTYTSVFNCISVFDLKVWPEIRIGQVFGVWKRRRFIWGAIERELPAEWSSEGFRYVCKQLGEAWIQLKMRVAWLCSVFIKRARWAIILESFTPCDHRQIGRIQ
jgi:hypothetical protein